MSGGLVKWTDVLPPTLPDPSILAKEPVERPQERSESVAASVASRGKGSKAPAGGMFDDETGVDDLGNFEDDDLLDLDDLGGGLAGGAKEDWIDDDLGVDDDFLDASMPRRMARPDDWKEGGARDGASFVSSYGEFCGGLARGRARADDGFRSVAVEGAGAVPTWIDAVQG